MHHPNNARQVLPQLPQLPHAGARAPPRQGQAAQPPRRGVAGGGGGVVRGAGLPALRLRGQGPPAARGLPTGACRGLGWSLAREGPASKGQGCVFCLVWHHVWPSGSGQQKADQRPQCTCTTATQPGTCGPGAGSKRPVSAFVTTRACTKTPIAWPVHGPAASPLSSKPIQSNPIQTDPSAPKHTRP